VAQIAIPGGFYIPHKDVTQGIPTVGFATACFLTGTGTQKVAWVFQVPKTGTLDKVELMCNFVSSPSDVKISFQDVDGSGLPDGTPDQYRVMSGITATWTVPGLMTSTGADGGSKRSVTVGDWLAVVTEWNSATTGEVDWASLANNSNTEQIYIPSWLSHNGTSYTKRGPNNYCGLALKYDDGTYAAPWGPCYPISTTATVNYGSGSTPDERALYFSFPVAVTVDGGWYQIDLNANVDIVLYDSDGTTPLATLSLDGDYGLAQQPHPRWFKFASEVALLASTNYRLAVKPTTATTVGVYEMTTASAAIMAALPGGAWHLSTRTDAGSWTQTTTTRPFAGLHVTKVADDALVASPISTPFVG
jgi:hypothetical protein